MPQVTSKWLLRLPTVPSIVVGCSLSADKVAKLDAASDVPPAHPVWHQRAVPTLDRRG